MCGVLLGTRGGGRWVLTKEKPTFSWLLPLLAGEKSNQTIELFAYLLACYLCIKVLFANLSSPLTQNRRSAKSTPSPSQKSSGCPKTTRKTPREEISSWIRV